MNEVNKVNAPATPEHTMPVTFTAEQQAHIDKVLGERLARANAKNQLELDAARAARLEAENKLREALSSTKKSDGDGDASGDDQTAKYKRVIEQSKLDVEAARKAADIMSTEAKAAKEQLVKYQKQTAIIAEAAAQHFIDPELACRLLEDNIQVNEDGKLTVIGDNGEQRYNAAYQPMSLSEYVAGLGQERKYLVRGDTKAGAGSATARIATPSQPDLKGMFGPASDAKVANALALKNPAQYRALRAQAVQAGLLPR